MPNELTIDLENAGFSRDEIADELKLNWNIILQGDWNRINRVGHSNAIGKQFSNGTKSDPMPNLKCHQSKPKKRNQTEITVMIPDIKRRSI